VRDQKLPTHFLKTQQRIQQERSNKMAQKKVTKIKVRDLKPTKDAKGGGGSRKPNYKAPGG